MRSTLPAAVAALALLLLAPDASSLSTQSVHHQRFTEATAESDGSVTTDSDSASDLGPFESQVSASFPFVIAEAAQVSSIDDGLILATGSALSSAFGPARVGAASSVLELIFELQDPATYSIDGMLQAETDGSSLVWLRDESAWNLGQPATLFYSSQSANPGSEPPVSFAASGTLDPGLYRLFLRAASCSSEIGVCGEAEGRSSYAVSLVLVPEPSMALLVSFALAACAVVRRSTRR